MNSPSNDFPQKGDLDHAMGTGACTWLVEQSGVSSMLRVIPVHRGLAQSLGLDISMARGSGFAMLKYV